MVVAALAAYKHDTLGRYLPTVLHFRLQAAPIPPEISSKRLNQSIDTKNYRALSIFRKMVLVFLKKFLLE